MAQQQISVQTFWAQIVTFNTYMLPSITEMHLRDYTFKEEAILIHLEILGNIHHTGFLAEE